MAKKMSKKVKKKQATNSAKKKVAVKPAKKVAAPKKASTPKKAQKTTKTVLKKATKAPKRAAETQLEKKKPLKPAPLKTLKSPAVEKKPQVEKAPEEFVDVQTIEVSEEVAEVPASESEEIVLTDAEGRRYCRVKDCDQLAAVDSYCRYHYLLFWKKIQVRKKILSEGKLERYIEELTARYPDKFLDMLRKDLRSEKEFVAAIQELEIDESGVDNEFEDEAQTYIDEVRGMGETGARDEEDF